MTSERPLPPRLLDAYLNTVVEDRAGIVWSGRQAVDRPPSSPVAVITAWNPFSQLRAAEVNHAANHDLLRKILTRSGETDVTADVVEAVGRSTDGSWSEECFVVTGLSPNDACRLAREFDQYAVFELTDDWHIVRAADGGELGRRHRLLDT